MTYILHNDLQGLSSQASHAFPQSVPRLCFNECDAPRTPRFVRHGGNTRNQKRRPVLKSERVTRKSGQSKNLVLEEEGGREGAAVLKRGTGPVGFQPKAMWCISNYLDRRAALHFQWQPLCFQCSLLGLWLDRPLVMPHGASIGGSGGGKGSNSEGKAGKGKELPQRWRMLPRKNQVLEQPAVGNGRPARVERSVPGP